MRLSQSIAAVAMAICAIKATSGRNAVQIPDINATAKRPITLDDVTNLRYIDSLSVSPDGTKFAIFVRQADATANVYRGGWFIGGTHGGRLTYVGDGGELLPQFTSPGLLNGEIVGGESRWSPDGQWIVYTLTRDGETQLWRSQADGSAQEQITRSPGDVQEFEWQEDGAGLYFTAGESRTALEAQDEEKLRGGYRYDEDLYFYSNLLMPLPPRTFEMNSSLWTIWLRDRQERLADASDRTAFEKARTRMLGGAEPAQGFLNDAVVLPVVRADGASAWLVRSAPGSHLLRVAVSLPPENKEIRCGAEECLGAIKKLWWSGDGERVLFWRGEGLDNVENGFYTWAPATSEMRTIVRVADDVFSECELTRQDRLVCVRETKNRPPHVAAVDFRSATVRTIADVNPEFRNIRLGKVERFEWSTPKLSWNQPGGALAGLYPDHAYGYILYPPNFDPAKKYPVFIEPYTASGFMGSVGAEHALHVYAANGFIVLNTAFPWPIDETARLGGSMLKKIYSAELGFPHMTMLAESTLAALDAAAGRGFIDQTRVGIGGVSHGTFIPLYIMQKHDRIAAISISGAAWSGSEYYSSTKKGREAIVSSSGKAGYADWQPKPEGAGREFWRQIDIADHINEIEAPILMNLADSETFELLRLIRHLNDASKPYDVYVLPGEAHIKWQPAHLQAIRARNIDWFRFWLQDYEDAAPGKEQQYEKWRKLKEPAKSLPH